jgi:hypothetical protein
MTSSWPSQTPLRFSVNLSTGRITPICGKGGALLLLLSLHGCAQNNAFSPPPDGEQVTITVKVPPNLAAEPMQVIYRSEKCLLKRSGRDWTSYEVDGYFGTTVHPQQQGQSDLYEAKLPVNGGGRCQWQLSNVTFGVTYANTAHFGENVEPGPGGGVIVMFDGNLPQQRSAFQSTTEVSGDALIKRDYYPWINEQFIDGHEKLVWLVGREDMYLYYRAPNARKVMFEPLLHADHFVYSVGPKVHKEGNRNRYTYADGSVEMGGGKPTFQKLQAIRLGKSQ